MGATPVIQSRTLKGLQAEEQGSGFGVFRTVCLLIGATGTAIVGAVADVAGWTPAFNLLSVLFAIDLSVRIIAKLQEVSRSPIRNGS